MYENQIKAHSSLFFKENVQYQLHLSEMPGENCITSGCSILRKDKGISIFKVALTKNESNKTMSQDLTHIILKYKQRNKSFNQRI